MQNSIYAKSEVMERGYGHRVKPVWAEYHCKVNLFKQLNCLSCCVSGVYPPPPEQVVRRKEIYRYFTKHIFKLAGVFLLPGHLCAMQQRL